MGSSVGPQRTVDLRWGIQGKIISYLHIPSGSDFWRFCSFISSHICKGCKFLNAHEERILALFFFVLEVISIVLDQIGKDKKAYLLAAFLLSAFGFAITLYSLIKARTNPTVIVETQLKVVEIVFSLIQLIIAFVQYLLTVLKVKNDYNASAFPLAFAMIAIVFTFIKDGKINDSSLQPVGSMNSTHIEPDEIGSSSNQVDTVMTICCAEANPYLLPFGYKTSTPIRPYQIGSSGNQVDSVTPIVKRSTNVGNKRGVFKLELMDDKAKKKAMETVAGISGVDSISMDFKNNELTMKGKFDPVNVANELRTNYQTELVSFESIRAEGKKEEKKKEEAKKEDRKPYLIDYEAYYRRKTPYHHLKTE